MIFADPQALNASILDVTLPNQSSQPIIQGDLDKLTAGQTNAPLLATEASAFGRAGQLQLTANSHRFPVTSGVKPTVCLLSSEHHSWSVELAARE